MLTYVDVGAAGRVEPEWVRPIKKEAVRYFGVEPDSRSQTVGEEDKLPVALGSVSGLKTLHLTRKPELSSLLKPNEAYLQRFQQMKKFQVLETAKVRVETLDSFDLNGPSFLKIDVQGGELEVLKGAKKTLKNCIGALIEVEFLEVYQKQPVFADINNFMTAQGFEFEDFITLKRWTKKHGGGPGQLVFGDALYLRDYSQVKDTQEHVDALVSVAEIYKRADLLLEIRENGTATNDWRFFKILWWNRLRGLISRIFSNMGFRNFPLFK